ncbi:MULTISPECIES: hypothetical protein [unclassified Dyadobacter]|uniref:hypothetical protein n=1 Tax=unclassified Dyadobacter TaxID=2625061 RepID=UPI001F3C323E|nr:MULTISPECIES: hypothetical protein [unclassified Dyadobacter]MCE7070555.1 hypothetical protein [Dyadobacter sp. CY327]MCF2488028.1 hypothetical protein [Dyadobacter sp. CY347]
MGPNIPGFDKPNLDKLEFRSIEELEAYEQILNGNRLKWQLQIDQLTKMLYRLYKIKVMD